MGKVYVVHCIDTEGPLNESLEATFKRIKAVSGIELQPSKETLRKIQNKELDLKGYEDTLAMAFSERIMAYNRDWTDLDSMLDNITSEPFRKAHSDSNGGGWKFTWFIMDHVDYDENPRNRIVGYNAIWDHYKDYYSINCIDDDEFQWHVHPANLYRAGNHCGGSLWNSPHVLLSLSHRLIDRGFFPEGFRAGFHTERPDGHWLLEQYIPYDFSNQAVKIEDENNQKDIIEGRFGDWRRARSDWGYYHPSHDDYQEEGNCHRTIFRCLNVGTRLRLITREEVDKAFMRARDGEDTVLAFCDHDFREMKYDIDEAYDLIRDVAASYPDVKWINSTAAESAKAVLREKRLPISIDVKTSIRSDGRVIMDIMSDQDSFGAQPFFALKVKGGVYRAEQLDVQKPNRQWSFVFDMESICPDDIEYVGIATNSRCGSGALKVLSLDGKVIHDRKW